MDATTGMVRVALRNPQIPLIHLNESQTFFHLHTTWKNNQVSPINSVAE